MEDPLLMSVREAGAAHGPPNVPPEAAVSAHKASEPSESAPGPAPLKWWFSAPPC